MTRIFCLLALICPLVSISQNTVSTFPLHGKVVSPDNTPLPGVNISLLKNKHGATTSADGNFRLEKITLPDTLLISHISYRSQKILIRTLTQDPLIIILEPSSATLSEVTVNTGYQSIPKERATGSFVQVDNELLNRSVSTSVLDRLDGITSGLIFNRNKAPSANESAIMIRGRSTLFAQVDPLIVVDNFPYDGDINSINPNDVETVSILRDAAAASIWGVRSGNGVIVITTKKGRSNQRPKISFNSNITIGNRPDLYYQPVLGASDYINMESFLFAKGYYNSRITNAFQSLTPAVEIFSKRRSGLISAADSASQINALSSIDARNDLSDYFYRQSISQQYALNFSGGGTNNQYYLSAGYDKNLANTQASQQDRITINAKNTFQLLNQKLEILANIVFTSSKSRNASAAFNTAFPIYTQLADINGNAMPLYKDFRKSWLDTIGQGQLLDWTFRPYDELSLANNKTTLTDYRILTGVKYKFSKALDISLNYQYENGRTEQNNLQGQQTYYTRDIINRYTQLDYTTKSPVRPVPQGDILDITQNSFTSNNARWQINYSAMIGKDHQLTALAGTEIKDYHSFNTSRRLFGYNEANATDISINPVTQFATLPSASQARILVVNGQSGITDRYFSYFGNAGYTYKQRYLFTVSARKDASNLFGVNSNQKGVPLWSVGAGWIVSNENNFRSNLLSYLKLRITYGYNGNIDKTTSAYTTAGVGLSSVFLQPTATIINPPNPELSWEKISMLNMGVDYALLHGIINGSFDIYYKKGSNLLGSSEVAAQTGITQFKQNIADIKARGIDLSINATPVDRILKWNINFLYSHTYDEVSNYKLKPSQVKRYVTNNNSNPSEGKPWSAIYAYRWAGLSSTTGDPQGYVNGAVSTDYTKLINPATTDELVYIGAGRPTHFGSLRNTFSYKQLSFSFNIMYSLGYYFRRPSVNYATAFSSSLAYGGFVHGDIARRWQQPGDEWLTNIPSLVYPANASRDEFFQYSETLVEKGDHIRLRDIQLSYDLDLSRRKNFPIKSCRVYLYANNIGILWRANHYGIDPDYVSGMPSPRTVAAGITIDL